MIPLPTSLRVNGETIDLASGWKTGHAAGYPGWVRRTKRAGKVTLKSWSGQGGIALLDVYNDTTAEILTVTCDGVDHQVWPLAGLPLGNKVVPPLNLVPATAGDGYAKSEVARAAMDDNYSGSDEIDKIITNETGSPRNVFDDPPDIWAQEAGGCSPALAAYLHEFVDYQVTRPYQDFGGEDLVIRTFTAGDPVRKPVFAEKWMYDVQHMTVDRLATAWHLTGNPRALDQLINVLGRAIPTEWYYDLHNGSFYLEVPRVPGWLFQAVARFLKIARRAQKQAMPGWEQLAGLAIGWLHFCRMHGNRIAQRWGASDWSPFTNTYTNGGHSPLPHDVPFMQAVHAKGCFDLAAFDPPFAQLGKTIARWLDKYGWTAFAAAPYIGTSYDAIHPTYGKTVFKPIEGVGYWLYPALKRAEEHGIKSDYVRRCEQHLRESNFRGYGQESYFAKSTCGLNARRIAA